MTSDASLWRQPAFLKLSISQAISQLGSQVSFLALPLMAVLMLGATPAQMGLLTAMSSLAPLLIGLQSGAVIDQRERRPIIIACDIGQAGLLGCIPLAWSVDLLSIELLYVVAFLTGALSLVSSVAHQAFLPVVVGPERLVDANSKMALMGTVAEVAGPSLASWLIQAFTAPFAIVADAVSFLWSALLTSRIRTREPLPGATHHHRRIRHDVWNGLLLALGEPRLRALIGSRATLNLFNAMLEAVFVLYIVRELHVNVALIGVIFSIGSVGFLIGALMPVWLADRLGVGPSMVMAIVVLALSDLVVPFAQGGSLVVVGLLVVAQFFFGLGLTVFNVNQASLRQALVPVAYLGRIGATLRVLVDGLTPLGAVLGGVMGAAVGLRETLILAALGELLAAIWLWRSPVGAIDELPSAGDART